MQYLLVAIILGALVGVFMNISPEKMKKISTLQEVGVYLLVASMGAAIGLNKELIANIPKLGLVSLGTAFLCTAGSVLFVYLLSKFLIKEKKEEKDER